MIVFCQGTYNERVKQTHVCLIKMRAHVDRCVVIVDQSVTEKQRKMLKGAGAEVHYREWKDDFPGMRNHYINLCKVGDWVCVSDPDEWYDEHLATDLRSILPKYEREGVNTLFVNSHDIWHKLNGQIYRLKSSFYKKLIFKKTPGTRYNGVGHFGVVHEHLSIPGEVSRRLPDKYFYEHHKFDHEVWERAARNVYIGGGGDNMGDRNPAWNELRSVCRSLGINPWSQMRDYMRKGNIDQRLKNWLVKNSKDTNNYEHEMMEMGKWYFEYLHPEENTCGWKPHK